MEVLKIEKGCKLIKQLRSAKASVKTDLPLVIRSLPESYHIEIQEAILKLLDEKLLETEKTIQNIINEK